MASTSHHRTPRLTNQDKASIAVFVALFGIGLPIIPAIFTVLEMPRPFFVVTLGVAVTVTLVGVIGCLRILLRRQAHIGPVSSSLVVKSAAAACLLITLSLAAAAALGAHSPPPIVENTIVSPRNGDAVLRSIKVTGTASTVPPGHQLWLLLEVPEVGRNYPGDGPIVVQGNGSWATTLTVGAASDAGKPYVIRLADVGSLGTKQLDNYQRRENQSHEVIGIPPQDLAPDVRLLASATIRRQ